MKTRNILILCTAFLVSMPSTDAQSFKDGLKSLGDKIGKPDRDKALQKQ